MSSKSGGTSSAKQSARPSGANANALKVADVKDKRRERMRAELGLSGVFGNTETVRTFARGTCGELDLMEAVSVMNSKVAKVQAGDLSEAEAMLTAQAMALDAIFTELTRRAAHSLGQHLNVTETYLRLALKAQSQCRTTVEALAEIKNPRPLAVVQTNIAAGHQQINNSAPAPSRAGEITIQANELSGNANELLPDTRASRAAFRIDTPLEAVAKVHRAKD